MLNFFLNFYSLVTVASCRINSVLNPEQSIESLIGSTYTPRVEVIPNDQLDVDQRTECLMPVAHFHR
uniref:ubiquitinyl hydrolase 1 n=1 Tax=Romanomermis culicivorax TaxID=13658 RepID=A0A915HUV9_ROMCU